MEKGHTINVLDHGYVKYIDSMGDDTYPIRAARMSTSGSFVSWEPYDGHPRGDQGLLEYLYKNRHSTPFEMCDLIIEVQAPIFVFREWHRHRTQSYNEMSARYTQMPNLHYVPVPARVAGQGTVNKQGSGAALVPGVVNDFRDALVETQDRIYVDYEDALAGGVARETARLNTPVSRYSKMWAKANVRNWLAFAELRMAEGAQWEIQQFAGAVGDVIAATWPRTYKLFERYTLNSRSFTKDERAALCQLLVDPANARGLRSALGDVNYSDFIKRLTA